MTTTVSIDTLQNTLRRVLGERIQQLDLALGELTLTVTADDYAQVALQLRDHPELSFEQLLIEITQRKFNQYLAAVYNVNKV